MPGSWCPVDALSASQLLGEGAVRGGWRDDDQPLLFLGLDFSYVKLFSSSVVPIPLRGELWPYVLPSCSAGIACP